MTNSSPQESQNPSQERRRRGIAGLTYDEIIAIIVAFSTIGGILFWSWGSKIGRLAGNFGLGRSASTLSGSDVGLGIGGINADSDLQFGELEGDRGSLNLDDEALSKDALAEDTDAIKFGIASGKNQANFELDSNNNLTALGVGAAALPNLANNNNLNQGFNISPERPDSTTIAPDPDIPEGTISPEQPDSTVTTPEGAISPEQPDSTAIAPENVEMPDDVVPSYWAYPFVKQMSDQALVEDFTETENFEPDKLITRGSMATLIGQAFKEQPEVQEIKQFNDVTDDTIAADIDKAVSIGFMQGYSDEEFRPADNIPRYQVLVTLATGLGLKPSQEPTQILQQFNDGLDIPDWAKQQVAAAAEAGLIVNKPSIASNSLSPNASATRGEVAAMIHQALVKTGKLEPVESEYIVNP